MKTAEEHWKDFQFTRSYGAFVAALKIYAAAAIEDQLDVAAEEAETEWIEDHGSMNGGYDIVNKSTIINCTRIELK